MSVVVVVVFVVMKLLVVAHESGSNTGIETFDVVVHGNADRLESRTVHPVTHSIRNSLRLGTDDINDGSAAL